MLDINLIRRDPQGVANALLKRMDEVDLESVIDLDTRRRDLIAEVDTLRARRNDVSADIPRLKKEGRDVSSYMEEMRSVSGKIKELDAQLTEVKDSLQEALDQFPNIPADDVPAGDKENNVVVREWGEKPDFAFTPRDHVELVESLGLIDYERGVKLGGRGFWLYRGDGALLEWALLDYFIRERLKDNYELILPPHILTYQCGYTAGQFPKFADDVFHLQPKEDASPSQFILPTAETALINVHRDEILSEEELPKKYFSFTPCYRKEAGSYRTGERGMIRGHQFNKVEMFQYTRPEDSEEALEELISRAEKLVQGLGLHYRVTKLAARDCSGAMAKTYDVEVWIPSMGEYKEVSSASNARDYQARRGNIRFKRKDTGKNELIHTLNASGLATSRILPAMVEQFQQEDGSVPVPEALQEWVKKKVLTP